MCLTNGIKKRGIQILASIYTKLKEKPLKKKQSIIALYEKLIRALFYICTRKVSYSAKDVLGPMHSMLVNQLQMAA
jgi:hypothetical protein